MGRGWVPFLLLAVSASACGLPPVESVRALRTYEREVVTPELVSQHLDELSGTLGLLKRILRETKYQPGDAWTQALALNDATAGQARALLLSENPNRLVPTTLAIYSRHVSDVLTRARAQADAAAQQTATAAQPFASILDALAQVDPALGTLRQDFETEQALVTQLRDAKAAQNEASSYQKMVRAAQASQRAQQKLDAFKAEVKKRAAGLALHDPRARQVVKDALATTSVALRLAGEAAALGSMLLLELPRLASLPRREYAHHAELAAKLIRTGPAQVAQIRADLEADLQSLTELVEALARLDAIDLENAPGFAYREGLVDEVVGFTLDMLHFKADAGGEAYFFQPFKLEGGRDYTGRVNKLEYHVDPIVLASARLSASFDLPRLPMAGGLKFGYATNRVYQSGGTIENSSLAAELGATGRWSDAIDAALLYSGWQSSVRLAHFTSGTVDVLQAADGTVATNAPFTFTLKEIAFSRELVSYGSPYVKSAVIKVGYFDYTLPRVMYGFQDTTPDADSPTWVYRDETPPQRVRTQLATWGATSMLEIPVLIRNLNVLFGFNLSWGFGRQKFYFPDADGTNKDHTPFTVALSALSHLGVSWRFVGVGSRFHIDAEAIYQGQYLNSSLGTTFGLDRRIPIGSHALFHGPHGRISASF